jgi:hypothetical protein
MNLDIRAHTQHRLSISLRGSVYCRDCDLYLTELETVCIEINPAKNLVELVVLTPYPIGN